MDVFSFSSYKINIPFVLKTSVPELSFLPLVVQSEQKKMVIETVLITRHCLLNNNYTIITKFTTRFAHYFSTILGCKRKISIYIIIIQ
jgi:hypothetical protein